MTTFSLEKTDTLIFLSVFTPNKNNLSFFKKCNYAQQKRSYNIFSVDIYRNYTVLFGRVKIVPSQVILYFFSFYKCRKKEKIASSYTKILKLCPCA